MFRGYVITKDKRCIEKFKDVPDEKLRTYEQVKNLDEYAGVLKIDTLVLDFDDEVQAEKAFKIVQELHLKCRVYKTTRGVHILFKNKTVTKCGTATRLACGLRADIKCGLSADGSLNNAYAIQKSNGVVREVIYDTNEYEEVPKFFHPFRSRYEFLNLGDGDGRNTKLFEYILALQSKGFSKNEAKRCLSIINTYVLAVPLPKAELETIMRDDAFKAESQPAFFDGKTFLFDKFAEYLKNKAHIVKINGRMHIYHDGIYIDSKKAIEAEFIQALPGLNQSRRNEVMAYLDLLIRDNAKVSPPHLIAFKNGVYDLFKDELLPFSEQYVLTNKINFNYTPGASSELVDTTLDKLSCNDDDVRSLLEEAIGYCFYRRNELGKAFILVGDGSREKGASNGKSTFLDMVKTLLGEENITSLDLSELNHEFKSAELFGKLANIGDDIDDGYIPNSAVFKKLVTGERIMVAKKYQDPFEFNNVAKLLFSANEIPKIKDRGGAIQRRLVIVPFLAHFSKNDPDFRPFIKYELQQPENIEYLIQLGIAGLKRVLENQSFTESDKVKIQLEEFEEENNPIVGFFKEYPELEVVNQTNTSVYNMYLEYCYLNNHKPLSKGTFSKQITARFNVTLTNKTVDKKTVRVFTSK